MSAGKRQLVEVITALRSDLEMAVKEGEGKNIRFDLDEIEVELHTQITKSGDLAVNGGVEFKILGFEVGSAGLEGSGSYSKETTHTIHLKLKPKQWDKEAQAYKGVEMSDLD